jgi:hypothetical protein
MSEQLLSNGEVHRDLHVTRYHGLVITCAQPRKT